MSAVVAPLAPADRSDWRRLWTAYLAFYGATVAEPVYDETWSRLLDDKTPAMRGFLARDTDGAAVGIVHMIRHPHCWRIDDVVYLQDLYVDAAARGLGLGRALIERVYAEADALGAPTVYWLTQTSNTTARQLYDRIATPTDFMKYQRA